MLKLLGQLSQVDGDRKDKEVKTFTETVTGIKKLGEQADKALDVLIKADENWFVGTMMKIFR